MGYFWLCLHFWCLFNLFPCFYAVPREFMKPTTPHLFSCKSFFGWLDPSGPTPSCLTKSTIPLSSRSKGSLGFPPNQCWDDTFHCLRRFLVLNIRPIHCKAIMEPATYQDWECKGWFKAETRNFYSPLHIERIQTGAEQLQFIDLQGVQNQIQNRVPEKQSVCPKSK